MGALIDITGKVFGRLTILRRNGIDGRGNIMWLCKCECGNETVVQSNNLRSGSTKSCGCLHREKVSKCLTKDITGKVFVNLTVINREGSDKDRTAMWRCKCICGNEVVVLGANLRNYNTRSCGCLQKMSVCLTAQDPMKIMKRVCTMREKIKNGTHHALKHGRYAKIEFH